MRFIELQDAYNICVVLQLELKFVQNKINFMIILFKSFSYKEK